MAGEKAQERKHALLSASAASRWMRCTPSARLCDRYPDRPSRYAEEGTLAHAYASQWLRHELGMPFDDEDAGTIRVLAPVYNSPEMGGFVRKYVDTVREIFAGVESRKAPADPVFRVIEGVSDYSRWAPEGFGTADAVIVTGGEMAVCDLKYGQGVRVDAVDNPQLSLYALGMLDRFGELPVERVTLHIIQPRLYRRSEWTTTAADLLKWGETAVAPLARMAWAGEGELNAGSWCRFCKHRENCGKPAGQ